MTMRRKFTLMLVLLATVLYAASLFLPAFTCEGTTSIIGFGVLGIGGLGIITLDMRWYANIGFVVLLVLVLRNRSKHTTKVLIAATTAPLALMALAPAPGCHAGGPSGLSTGLAVGGYLWLVALLMICVVACLRQNPVAPTSAFSPVDDGL